MRVATFRITEKKQLIVEPGGLTEIEMLEGLEAACYGMAITICNGNALKAQELLTKVRNRQYGTGGGSSKLVSL